ncbi:MAG: ProQ activator of osmoprotectant transporter prop [Rhodocyclaceae bacterium]|nr:ProQ activator of osmoprotectant transporter prop [Rhodocyclaceae bacterium]
MSTLPAEPREFLTFLQTQSPAMREWQPLSIGSDKTIAELFPDASRRLIRTTLRNYTQATRYLKNLQLAQVRFHFDGSEAEAVLEEHRQHAAQTLKERFAAAAKRRREAEASAQKQAKLQQLVEHFGGR